MLPILLHPPYTTYSHLFVYYTLYYVIGAIFFAVKDSVKQSLRTSSFSTSLPILSHLSKEEVTVLSVVAANVFYWLIRTPAEELKTKEQIYGTGATATTTAIAVTTTNGAKSNSDNSCSNNNDCNSNNGAVKETWLGVLGSVYKQQGIQAVFQRLYGSYASNIAYALPADIAKFVACKLDCSSDCDLRNCSILI